MSSSFIEVLQQCVMEAGANSLRFLNEKIEVGVKASHRELVTHVDRHNEQIIAARIKTIFPHHQLMGEESYREETFDSDDYVWIIDPIDGTTNYLHQKQCFAISVALYRGGEAICGAVYNPLDEELYVAEKGSGAFLNNQRLSLHTNDVGLSDALIASFINYNEEERKAGFDEFVTLLANRSRGIRMIGCGSLELAYVASGRFDAYVSFIQKPWDYAAGKLLIEEAGGAITTIKGQTINAYRPQSILASANVNLHEQVRSCLPNRNI